MTVCYHYHQIIYQIPILQINAQFQEVSGVVSKKKYISFEFLPVCPSSDLDMTCTLFLDVTPVKHYSKPCDPS